MTPTPPIPPTHEHAIYANLTRSHGQPPHHSPAGPRSPSALRPRAARKPPKPSCHEEPPGPILGPRRGQGTPGGSPSRA